MAGCEEERDLFLALPNPEDGPDDDDVAVVEPELPLSPIASALVLSLEGNDAGGKDRGSGKVAATSSSSSGQTTTASSDGKKATSGSAPAPSKKRPTVRWGRKTKIKLRDHLVYWLDTKYEVLPEVLGTFEEACWQEAAGPDDDIDLLWCDGAISVDRFSKLRPYQKVNHFVGMTSITRKNSLGRNLLRMRRRFPEEYRFFPETWILPTDLVDLKAQFNGKRNKTFIVKPSDGYQGKGIFLTRDFENIPVDYNSTLVVQRYIHKPYLLDGHKFDLRLYVLVTGCDPLRIFLHKHGLVRLAVEEYTEPKLKNLANTMMHLTNYAINCDNADFQENTNPEDGTDGHKRSFQAVLNELRIRGVDIDKLLSDIEDLVIKTLVAVQPSLSHVYHCCQPDDVENAISFEILGFDIMLDHEAKPWLIEVNHAPSFRTETELDRMVKFDVLKDCFELLNINLESRRRYRKEQTQSFEARARGDKDRRSPAERAALEEELAKARDAWECTVDNGYKRLYPVKADPSDSEEKPDPYAVYLEAACDIWEMLTGATSRRKSSSKEKADDKAAANGKKTADERSKIKSSSLDAARIRSRPADRVGNRSSVSMAASPPAARPMSPSSQDTGVRSRSAEKAPLAAAAAALMSAGGRPPSIGTSSKRSHYADIEVGDAVQVQTNLGWEPVVVRKKHDSGHLDIQFADGEMMREVLPRILRQTPAAAPPGQRVDSRVGEDDSAASTTAGDVSGILDGSLPDGSPHSPTSAIGAQQALAEASANSLQSRLQKLIGTNSYGGSFAFSAGGGSGLPLPGWSHQQDANAVVAGALRAKVRDDTAAGSARAAATPPAMRPRPRTGSHLPAAVPGHLRLGKPAQLSSHMPPRPIRVGEAGISGATLAAATQAGTALTVQGSIHTHHHRTPLSIEARGLFPLPVAHGGAGADAGRSAASSQWPSLGSVHARGMPLGFGSTPTTSEPVNSTSFVRGGSCKAVLGAPP
eukprot:TRINITY_DN30523_c0_g1_i1.p1 TRINITY_DN30523_c0_g1~~TRINITY_DN30523_c0_g1_i1.p1  ORF type:complete len:982 (-),score=159.06 TRINITY_DN30523_c0_g1_i1:613-3558(-)